MPLDPQRITKPLRKVRKALGHPSRSLTPEGVHKLRTQCYRIESMLRAFSLDQSRAGARLLQSIEPIRKRAGKLRDMDVLTGLAATLSGGDASEPLVQLVEDLGARHAKHLGKLKKTLCRERGRARQALKSCRKKMEEAHGGSKSDVADRRRRSALTHALELSSELAQWPKLGTENLHPFRLKVKELRYVLQLSSDSDRQLIGALGEAKDALGEWHDWSELAALAGKVLGGQDWVSKRAAAVAQSRLGHALKVAMQLRKQFFDMPQGRRNARRGRRPRIKTPAPATAARLAA